MELLAELLSTKVHLGLLAGHPSFEEGTEHYLAYFLEPYLTKPAWHGELLFSCLLVCAYLQDWSADRFDRLRALIVHLSRFRPPRTLISPVTLRELLLHFLDYCRRQALNNSIINDHPPSHEQIRAVVAAWERGW